MKKLIGTITETLRREVQLEADSEAEARDQLEAMYRREEIVLVAEDWFDTDYSVREVAEGEI